MLRQDLDLFLSLLDNEEIKTGKYQIMTHTSSICLIMFYHPPHICSTVEDDHGAIPWTGTVSHPWVSRSDHTAKELFNFCDLFLWVIIMG